MDGLGQKLGQATTDAAKWDEIYRTLMALMQTGGAGLATAQTFLDPNPIGKGVGVLAAGGLGAMAADNWLGREDARSMQETGRMIARQGDTVAQSPRMAETLSMASHMTGQQGPQSVDPRLRQLLESGILGAMLK